MKIGNRIALLMTVLVCAIFVITTLFTVLNIRKSEYEQAKNLAAEMASRYGAQVKGTIEKALDASLASAASFLAFTEVGAGSSAFVRDLANDSIKKLLLSDDRFYGIQVVFRPNMFDGNDEKYKNIKPYGPRGIYGPYYWKENGKLMVEDIMAVNPETTRAWYMKPRDTKKPFLTEPYKGVSGAVMSTISVPILKNEKFLGIVGIDFVLSEFSRIVKTIHPMGTGRGCIISNEGIIVAHPDEKAAGKKLSEILSGSLGSKLEQTIKNGEKFQVVVNSSDTGEKYFYSFAPILIEGVSTPWSMGIMIPEKTILAKSKSILKTNIFIAVVSILIIVLCIFLITRSVGKSIGRAVASLKLIGQGDLSQRIPVTTQDEIGEMANEMNLTMEKLQTLIKDIGRDAMEVDSTSSHLTDIANTLSTNAQDTVERCSRVVSAAERMDENMSSVTVSIEESSTNTAMVVSAAEEMASTINEIVHGMDQASDISGTAVEQAQSAAARMEELKTAAQEIGKVTETITTISEQIDLLALNSTIEAARAGAAGKGFAVVANETKELASQTADATREIQPQIQAVQNTAMSSIDEIDKIVSIINQINEIVSSVSLAIDQQSKATQEIAKNISHISCGLDDVSHGARENAAMLKEVVHDISDVNSSSVTIESNSIQLSEGAQSLEKLSQHLDSAVNMFTLKK